MRAADPEVLLMAAWRCRAAAGLWLDQGFRPAAILCKPAGEEAMGRMITEDRYPAWDHFLTPEVVGLDAGCCV